MQSYSGGDWKYLEIVNTTTDCSEATIQFHSFLFLTECPRLPHISGKYHLLSRIFHNLLERTYFILSLPIEYTYVK